MASSVLGAISTYGIALCCAGNKGGGVTLNDAIRNESDCHPVAVR